MIAQLLISAGLSYFLSLPFASVLQGGNYRAKTVLRARKELFACVVFFLFLCACVVTITLFCRKWVRALLTAGCYLVTGGFVFAVYHKMKMPLVFTNRLIRLVIGTTILYILLFFSLSLTEFYSLWSITPSLAPFVLLLAMTLLNPFEKWNNSRYIKKAKDKLDAMQSIKIGITGSYGKTSVKTHLDCLFSLGHNTLVSPSNYNTPLGFAKTMDCATGKEEYVILEMGARRKGDIREMCEIIHPSIGVITGIAPQHLETFGSIQEILAEKGELARCVAEENPVFFNLTDPEVRKLYNERQGKKVGVGFEDAEYLIKDLTLTETYSRFILSHGKKRIPITLPGIGIAFAVNFALAATVALECGVSQEEVQRATEKAFPAPHRFEVISRDGVTIIDDSYNVNPIGAKTSLDSLRCFPGKRKIVYSSGMVELGNREKEYNKELGKEIAEAACIAIVCDGRYGDYVVEGIRESRVDMPVYRVKDTQEASKLFASILNREDLLLIMSDLPRDYLL